MNTSGLRFRLGRGSLLHLQVRSFMLKLSKIKTVASYREEKHGITLISTKKNAICTTKKMNMHLKFIAEALGKNLDMH